MRCNRVARLCLAVLPMVILAPSAGSQCVTGTISADQLWTGPFLGLYKYTVSITWSAPRGLSNVTLDFGLGACPAAACGSEWLFDPTAGVGYGGDPNYCEFEFRGEFNCRGNPSIGVDYPVLKWDVVGNGTCEAGYQGSATLHFYSPYSPTTPVVSAILIKNGQYVCEGRVEGLAPLVCAVPVARSSWAGVKALYR